MARIRFRAVRFGPGSLQRIEECNAIIEEYQGQGLRLTLRQLYYQLVSRNLIPNEERTHKNLSTLVSDARMAGEMDWDAIEDRVRQPRQNSEFDDLGDLVEAACASYRLPRWKDQTAYVELWVEKDALAGVLQPIARKHHVTMMVNRGYSSQSAMFESGERFRQHILDSVGLQRRLGIVLYLGDHDPSGEDMVRDIRERLGLFTRADVKVIKLALTMSQIEDYDPPPNPAKVTDPRAAAYIAKHGNQSWEVDALPPDVLTRIIETAIGKVVDKKKMQRVLKQEEEDKRRLRSVVGEL